MSMKDMKKSKKQNIEGDGKIKPGGEVLFQITQKCPPMLS